MVGASLSAGVVATMMLPLHSRPFALAFSSSASSHEGGAGSFQAGSIQAPESLKLYQYQVCPFCNKVKAFLEYHGIPYEMIEVNPLTKEEIKFSEYRMVPFALINGKQVNGSGEIIEVLSAGTRFSLKEDTGARPWCEWVDDHLVHLLPPNIYRTPSEALQSFEYITTNSNFSAWQQFSVRYAGAAIMYMVAKRSKKKYNISEPRKELVEALEHWTNQGLLKEGGRFHGGEVEPDIADITVYGVLRSIDGNYDTWFDLKEKEFKNSDHFWKWYEDMDATVKKSAS